MCLLLQRPCTQSFLNKILGFKNTVDIKIFVWNKFLFLFVGDTNPQKLNSRGVVLHLLLYYVSMSGGFIFIATPVTYGKMVLLTYGKWCCMAMLCFSNLLINMVAPHHRKDGEGRQLGIPQSQ